MDEDRHLVSTCKGGYTCLHDARICHRPHRHSTLTTLQMLDCSPNISAMFPRGMWLPCPNSLSVGHPRKRCPRRRGRSRSLQCTVGDVGVASRTVSNLERRRTWYLSRIQCPRVTDPYARPWRSSWPPRSSPG